MLYFVYDSRPLRNPFGTMQPAAQAAGCFCCPADEELAPRTTDNENRQEVRRTDGCMIPKGLPGPPRAAPRCRKRSAAESRPPRSSPFGAGVGYSWRRWDFGSRTCAITVRRRATRGAGLHGKTTSAPGIPYTCAKGAIFLCIFVAPLSHQIFGDAEKCVYFHTDKS